MRDRRQAPPFAMSRAQCPARGYLAAGSASPALRSAARKIIERRQPGQPLRRGVDPAAECGLGLGGEQVPARRNERRRPVERQLPGFLFAGQFPDAQLPRVQPLGRQGAKIQLAGRAAVRAVGNDAQFEVHVPIVHSGNAGMQSAAGQLPGGTLAVECVGRLSAPSDPHARPTQTCGPADWPGFPVRPRPQPGRRGARRPGPVRGRQSGPRPARRRR